jgi:hypothetical protein
MRLRAALVPLLAALVAGSALPASAQGFAIEAFQMQAIAEGGAPEALAGAHPYEMTAKVAFDREGAGPYTEGDLRDLRISLPPGLIENPDALPKCGVAAFHAPRTSPFEASASGESCPADTQIGTATVHSSYAGGSVRTFGLFNLAPAPGLPAQLGFAPYGVPIAFNAHLRGTAGEYGIDLEARNFPQAFDLSELELTIWGTPWGVSHNGERGNCLNEAEPGFPWAKCSVGAPLQHPPLAYLTMPASCTGPLAFAATAAAWQGGSAEAVSSAPGLEECDTLRFDPRPVGQLTNPRTTSPSGYQFDLTNDNEALLIPTQRVPSQVRKAVLALPEGVTVDPSMAAGLGGCSPAGYEAETASSPPGAGCPNDSKIGDFTVSSPLVEERIEGAIFLATPHDNPFDSLLAIYLVAKAPASGVLVKLAGRIEADPSSGRLTVTFDDLPQLPYTDLSVHLREGQRAPLVTPSSCGPATTQIDLTPWLGSLGEARRTGTTQIEAGIGGGPCPSGTPPFHPLATGGSLNSAAGRYTPFYLHLTRTDAEQEITSYSAVLPPGLTGRLAAVPYCPEADIAAAAAASGAAEEEHPSCPAASQVGRTVSGYGVGSALAYAPGRLYLAGPYRGSPLSLVAIDSARVGPFDLGTVVIRSAFAVDPTTAQLSIDSSGSDPIPHILDGIPLHLRDIRVYIDRPQFALNPTSCEAKSFSSTLTGSAAPFANPRSATATETDRFQVIGCSGLGFAPMLGLRLRGAHRRGAHPAFRAVFETRPGDANMRRIAVTLPGSEYLAQAHIRGVCTQTEFNAGEGDGASCPTSSAYGRAVAYTPLFEEPLRGEVFLRSSHNPLPDVVVALRQGAIHVVLDGRVLSGRGGGIKVLFAELPDAPLERFVLTMQGGKRGLLENSTDVCRSRPRAVVRAIAQNERGVGLRPALRASCGQRKKHRAQRHKHRGHRKRRGRG